MHPTQIYAPTCGSYFVYVPKDVGFIFSVLAIISITSLGCAGPAGKTNLTTPKDFLFGLDKHHPIVQAVNATAYDVLKGNRMTAKVEENEKIFTFTTPSRIKEKDSHLDYAGKSWLWDSCFHVMILAEKELEVAKDELRSRVTAKINYPKQVMIEFYFVNIRRKKQEWFPFWKLKI